jgi:hypothetical protein
MCSTSTKLGLSRIIFAWATLSSARINAASLSAQYFTSA